MGLFYDRIEKPDRVIIRYSRVLYFYAIFLLGLLLPLFPSIAGVSSTVLLLTWFILLFFIYTVDLSKPNAELRKAMQEGKVLVSGNRFSLANPQTAEIRFAEGSARPEGPAIRRILAKPGLAIMKGKAENKGKITNT